MSIASSHPLDGSRERLAWFGVLCAPLLVLFVLLGFPALNIPLENHWFHFEIVTFVSLLAFVLGITTFVLLKQVPDARAFFIPLGLGAIAGIFFVHGISTPGVVAISIQHEEHITTVPMFTHPELAVAWSAPLSLIAGACFFALASLHWSEPATQWILRRRRILSLLLLAGYGIYVVSALAFPLPLEWLNQGTPGTRYFIVFCAALLYLGAAWQFWRAYREQHARLDAALVIAAVLLAEALPPLVLLPVWSLGWWLYHVWMLLAFCLALGAVVLEYERARHFQLSTYFTAVGVIVTVLLAFVAGDLLERLITPFLSAEATNIIRWSAALVFLLMAFLMLGMLWIIVRRGDMLLRANSLKLQQQQAALERGRIAETLAPIGVAMGESLDLERVLNLICRESHALFQVDTTLLWYKQGEELIACAAFGQYRAEFLDMRQPIQNNPLLGARVVREQRPLFVNHALRSSGVSTEIVQRMKIESIMGVPLLSEGEVLGSLVLIDLKNAERFGALDLDVARVFGQQAAQALTHARLYEKIQDQTRALTEALEGLRASYSQTLAALSAALDARDRETEGHSHRVTAYALLLAEALSICDPQTLEAIEWGALLHDVGKIGVPDAILHKPERLTENEWNVMRQHPEIGYQILQSIPFLQPAFGIVRHHHERWDGAGYPMNLRGENIPLPARIFAIADTLDAMTTNRPYRRAQSFQSAYQEIMRMRGKQFDPQVVDAFVTISQDRWRRAAAEIPNHPPL